MSAVNDFKSSDIEGLQKFIAFNLLVWVIVFSVIEVITGGTILSGIIQGVVGGLAYSIAYTAFKKYQNN